MELFDFFKKKKKRTLITEEYYVRGTEYYLNNIKKLTVSNKEYKAKASTIISDGHAMQKIFQHTYINKPVKLVEEPKNKHDKNAVQVWIAGELVGYIPAENCLHIKKVLKKHDVKYISSFISGGKYKVVSTNGDIEHLENRISICIKVAYV